MPTYESGQNLKIAFKVQSAKGTPSTGAGARGLDVRPSQGLQAKFAQAVSRLVRRDGMSVKPRQGSRHAPGAYETELVHDGLDEIFEAVLRGTWAAAGTLTEATLTSLAISDSGTTITAGGGSFITDGVWKGMMIKLANMSTAANNGKWVAVLDIPSATVLTVEPGILTDQSADTDFDMVVASQLIQADPPTERYFTVEQYLQGGGDISARALDAKFYGLTLVQQPDEPAVISIDLMGRDLDILGTGDSPNFSSPTYATANPLYLADGAMYVNGVAVAAVSGVRLALVSPASTLPIINSRLSPEVYLANAILGGDISLAVDDDTWFNYALNETPLSMLLRFSERESDPADFVTFFFGNLSVGDFGMPIGNPGALVQTFPIVGGKDEGGEANGFAPTMVMISKSST